MTREAVGANKQGSPTFADTKGTTPGPQKVGYGQHVQISCKVLDPSIPSATPDGYWYRIASSPWNDHYYAVANTFTNGDPLGSPGSHNTDWNIPNC